MQRPSLLLALLPSLVTGPPARAEILERVVAKVNGDIVTLSDFQTRQISAAQAARVGPERVEAFLRQNNARILQEAIDELLLTQRADELGMKAPPQAVKEIIDGIKKENNLETDAELEEQLRREGMTMDDLRRSIGRSMLRRYVLQREIEAKLAVSEEDSYAEYQARKAEFTKPETVTLEEILVLGDDAEAKAQALLGRARGGEDFAALARAYSQAPSAKNGGELGRLARGEMNPELEKHAFALAKGAVSDPIPQGEGYRILRVADKTELSVVPYDEAKKEIRQKLAEQRMQKEYEAYLNTLRQKAIVDIRVREVPLQLSGPVPDNVLLDTPLLGGGGGPPAPTEDRPDPASPPARPPAAAPATSDQDEFSTTPQAAPERVVPPPLPGTEKKDEKKPEPPPPPQS